MKILTVAIPCYNSENYMDKCIRSLLPAGEVPKGRSLPDPRDQ